MRWNDKRGDKPSSKRAAGSLRPKSRGVTPETAWVFAMAALSGLRPSPLLRCPY
jgi:hypothetical protein